MPVWALLVAAMAALRVGVGLAFYLSGDVDLIAPSPVPVWAFALLGASFAVVGGALIVGAKRDPRAAWLGGVLRHLESLSPANVLVLKKFLDLTWSQSQQITNLIIAAVKQGAHDNGGKTTNGVAMGKWRNLLQPHVYNVLMSGGNWPASKTNVLLAAGSMGNIAAILTQTAECKENQLKAAFRAAKSNTVCSGEPIVGCDSIVVPPPANQRGGGPGRLGRKK